jgi:hypothetical protein
MKNLTIGLITATTVFLLSAMAALAQDTSASITPGTIGPGNSGPSTYMAWRAVDIGLDIDGSGSSINPTNIRMSNYAFMGEQIYYYVLVRDDNGAVDINQVSWNKDGSSEMGPCDPVPMFGNDASTTGTDAYFCVPKHLITFASHTESDDLGECGPGNEKVYIDEATNLNWDSQTDLVYRCILTVEPQWTGTGQIKVSAKDQSGACGSTLSETWTFNPPLSISLTTSNGQSLTFGSIMKDQAVPGISAPNCLMKMGDLTDRVCGAYDPEGTGAKLCDISFSTNKLVLTNTGVVDLWPYIAATDFYDSTGMAKCPFSNYLSANQFEYNAVQGSWSSGWRVMPQYSPNLGCTSTTEDCRGGCRITTGCPIDVLSPNHAIEIALKIVWPTPCIGTFNNGSIYTIVRAV